MIFQRIEATKKTERRVENNRVHFGAFSLVSVKSLNLRSAFLSYNKTQEPEKGIPVFSKRNIYQKIKDSVILNLKNYGQFLCARPFLKKNGKVANRA